MNFICVFKFLLQKSMHFFPLLMLLLPFVITLLVFNRTVYYIRYVFVFYARRPGSSLTPQGAVMHFQCTTFNSIIFYDGIFNALGFLIKFT